MEEVNTIQNRMAHLEEEQGASSKQLPNEIHGKESETDKQQRQFNEFMNGMHITIHEIRHGIASVKSSFKEAMDISKTLKGKMYPTADEGVGSTIKQVTSLHTEMIDIATEYRTTITRCKHNEKKWSEYWSAQKDLFESINEHGKEIQRVRDEFNQSEEQRQTDCNDFMAGTWRDDTAGNESLVIYQREHLDDAELRERSDGMLQRYRTASEQQNAGKCDVM